MAALDLRDIEESGCAPDQQPAWKRQLRNRLKTALVDRPRAIGDAPATFENRPDRRMRLEALEFLERA
jgi:hypothetical protein